MYATELECVCNQNPSVPGGHDCLAAFLTQKKLLFLAHMQGLAVVSAPNKMVEKMANFTGLTLRATLPVSMSGSQQQFTAFIFQRRGHGKNDLGEWNTEPPRKYSEERKTQIVAKREAKLLPSAQDLRAAKRRGGFVY